MIACTLGLILSVLAIFMPYFVYRIKARADEHADLLRLNLEAQNSIIKILWDTQQQSKPRAQMMLKENINNLEK